MALTEEQRKKKKELEAEQAKAIQKAASAFKSNPSSIPKKYQSKAKETSKKQEKYSKKTAKKNYTVGKNGSIKAKATKATKNYISGKSSNASGRKLTGTEKFRNSAGWYMTQEERFLKQRQYQRTQADTSTDKRESIAANAKDEADTRETITKNYNRYAAQTARQAKQNAEKYRQTGEDKYLDQAKADLNRARTFEHQRDWAVTSAFQARQDATFYETAAKYDKYLKDTNPEYKKESSLTAAKDRLEKAKKDMQDLQGLMSPAAMSKKSNQEKLKKAQKELDSAKKAYDKLVKNAETSASDKYKEMFGDLTSDVDKQKLKDEAERLINLEAPTQSQQAEIRVIKGLYDQLPADEKDRRVQDRLFANSGTTMSRIAQTVGAGVSSALAGLERLPEFIEGLNETTSRNIIGGGEGMKPYVPEGAAEAVSLVDSEDLEKKRQKAMEWLDKQATKSEKKAEARRTNAQQNASELGKAAVDLGITLTQVGLDTLAGGPEKALAMMGARVLGDTYHEAKESGADTDDAVMYAGLQATKEILSEKIFGTALPIYGKGMARSLEKVIDRAVDKAATRAASKAGERATKFFFTSLANFLEEGGEELVSGALDPIVRAATIGDKNDLKAYVPGTEENETFVDDLVDQFVMGGLAGFLGGAVTQTAQRFPGVDEKTRTEIEKERAAKSFTPVSVSDFSQSLINNGIKNKAAVNADTVITNLVTNEAEVSDKQINKMLDDLHITKKGAKTSGAQRNLTALKNRLGLTDLDSNISRADLVKAIREGAKIAKQNADMQTDADVRGMEEQQEAEQVRAEVDDAEQDISNAERSQQTITIGDETLTHDQYAERMQAVAEANGNVLTDEQINTLWDQAVSEFGTPVEEEAPQQIEGQMDLFGEMGRTDEEEAKFLEDTFGIKRGEDGQMNMFDAMDEDTFKEQTFGIKKQKDEMETLAEETQRKQNSVLEKNEAADKLAPETQENLNTLAGNIGYRIEVHDHIPAPKGAADMENAIINGYIDKDTGTIHIAMDATDDIETTRSRILKVVAIHETTHGLETLAPEEYQAYSDYVENNWDVLNDGEDFATALENKMKQYADAGQDIGEVGARQELMAEFASHMDQDAIFDFVNSNPTIGQKIVDMWKSIVAKLREAFGMSGDAGEALRRWETAYRAATAKTIRAQDTRAVRDSANSNVEIVDNNGEFIASNDGNGHMMFSVSTLGLSEDETTFTGPGGQVVEGWIADQEDLSDESKKALKDGLIAIYKTVKPIADSGEFEPFTSWSEASVRLDNKGNPIISVVTPNDEYEMNLDHGSVCVKRQTLDAVIEELVRRGSFNDFKMDGPDIVEINRIIGENNFDVTCSICFVEQRRYRQVKLAEEFSDMYNEFVRGMMPEGTDATYFNYGGNQRLDEHNATITNDVSQLSDEDLALDTKYTVERSEKDENGKTKTVNREMTLQELKDEKNDNGGLRQGVDNKIARYLLASPEARHLLDRGDFAYAGAFDNAKESSPKVKLQEGTDTITDIESLFVAKGGAGRPLPSHNPTQYLHEMLADEDKFDVEEAFRIGGVRRQSASDFIPHMFFDYAEEVFDLEARGLPEHTYAKVPSYVWLFGLTGEKMNMSFIPAIDEDGVAPGLDADGNYVWLDGQTFPEEEAYKIADAPGYTKNCGPTAVGASDPHIEKMLDDDKISMIIPYHKSNANPVVAAMNGTSYMVDYTGYQNTRHQDGTKLSASEAKKVPNYNELLRQYEADDNDAPKKAAEDYVRWCEDNNYLPKFDQFAYAKDENGDYIVNEDGRLAVRDGYYKVLTDFKLYDKDGNYCPQEAVKQRYPDNLEEILRDALKGETELEENRKAKVSAITDTVENVLRNDLRQKALTAKEVAADKARVKALNDENTARYKAEQEKRRAALQPKSNIQFSISPTGRVEGFYSELQNTINGSKQHKMKPSQWLQYAKGHGQIKQEEIDYSGILSLPDESITKDDLLDYLRANQIELEEEVLEDPPKEERDLTDVDLSTLEYNDASYSGPYDYNNLLMHLDIRKEEIADDYAITPDSVEMHYELDPDRREISLLVSLIDPETGKRESYVDDVFFVESDDEDQLSNTKWGRYTTLGNTNYREILLKIPGSSYTNAAMNTHWGSDKKGVLAHARVDDFTNEAGEKVLFVEEIQSDWHNAGRDTGYRKEDDNTIRDKMSKARDRYDEINRQLRDVPLEDTERRQGLINEMMQLTGEYQDRRKTLNVTPDAPFKDSYVSLTLKRLLSEAVEKGYDRLAWTTAQMQSDRWSGEYSEGYRIEYDQEIPKFLNKYVKKWGSKVENMEMLGENTGSEKIPVQMAYEVPSIPITDAMRESIGTKGQPQFSLSLPRNADSVLGQNNTVPTEEEIKSGSATYGGLPIVYHPEMKADARNMDTEVWVSDKFFNDPDQQHILNHELAHNLSDELMSMHTGDWQEFASNFIEEKQTPPSSSAYANGNRTYWEGLYGDIGATALSETTTQAISEYLDDPDGLRQRSEDAYNVIDSFMRSREDNTQFSISEKQNSTDEILQKMYESLGLSPNAQPMTFAKETKQSKVNANTFTNTTIFDDAMQYARDSNKRIRMQVASDRIKEIGKYDVVSEQESMARAKERLEADYQGEVNKLILEDNNNEEWGSTDLDVAMGIMHTELSRGDIDAFYDAAKAVQEKGTKAGQLIQAFAKYSRTPEGVAVQALDDIEEKLGKIPPDLKERIGMLAQELRAIEDGDMDSIIELIKKQAKIRKTPIGKHTINQLYKETYQANYDRAVTQLLGIAQDEEAKHIKADAKSIGQKISTWQLVSHLLNLRTGARNVVSNTVFGFAETIANDLALVPDFLVSLGTGNRTVGGEILTPKALAAGVARARSSAIDIKLDVAPDDSRTKYGNTRRTWKMASRNPGAKAMSVLEMLMGYELNVTDEFAKGMHEYRVRSGLQKWVDAGMYDEKTVDQFAEKEMLYRTFQDDTFPGVILGGIKKGLNVIGFGHTGQYLGKGQKFEVKQFGMGDLVQKYTQVPGALLARLVEYSPAGYAKAIYNLGQIANAKAQLSKEGKKNRPSAKKTEDLEQKLLSYQRELSLSMGRATTGAGFIQMFFALAASGLLHDEGSEDDDDQAAKNEAAIRALQGISGTQLNLSALGRWIDNHNDDLKWKSGDTLINIDFLEPMNGLMSIAAVLAQDEYFDRDDIDYTVMGGDILHSIVNSFAQVPTMQSIQNIQNAVQYHSADSKYRIEFEVGLELLKGSVTGFVPGPVRQAAQYQDDYYRETYGSNDPIEQMRDALKNSIPGQRQTLDTKLTPYGTDKEMEDRRMRALNAFVNPGKLSEYKESELESILSDMGAAKLYPTRKAPNKLGFGNDKKLTPSEKRMYLETMGQTYTEEMNKIISTDAFKNASKGEQRDRLLEVKTFADQYAKTKIAENLGTTYGDSDIVDKTLTAIDKGIDLPQWIDYKSDIKGLNAKDKNGNSVDGLKKERTVAVIADMDISDEAKDYLYVELQKSNGVKEENLLKGLEKTPWHGGNGKFTK